MPSVTCTNCNAVLKTKEPVPAGKKVKCPKCGEPFVVQAEDDENAAAVAAGEPSGNGAADEETPKKKSAAADDDAEGGDDDAPKKGKGKDGKKSNTGMIIGIIVGVLLLCCCLPTCGSAIFQLTVGGLWELKSDRPIQKFDGAPRPVFDKK